VSVIIITTSELLLTPEELLNRFAQLVTPLRIHKHRTCGVLAQNACLRRAVRRSGSTTGRRWTRRWGGAMAGTEPANRPHLR
jgi:hypothetical protein